MNSVLTKPKSLQELYRTYFQFANKFEFTSVLRNYIQNEEWKDTTQQGIWNMMSKVSDDIGSVLTDDIVNYTRNIIDINTCKIPQLIEHSQMLSYGLDHLKNAYDFFPSRVKCLVDIFSINPEYLLGNKQNHVLSDQVIKEILLYIKDNVDDISPFTSSDVLDRLIDDPHGLLDYTTYKNFVQLLFYNTLVDALSAKYSDEDGQPIVFNMLHFELRNQNNVITRLDEYRSWVDKFISNEIEHPLNSYELPNTIYDTVQTVKNQKQMSSKFNPFKIADHIYFNGLNPTNGLSQDELDLVEIVLNYHSRSKYDYYEEKFISDEYKSQDGNSTFGSTKYAYYKELEFCEYVKLVMFIMNNLDSFNMNGLSYDLSKNKFIQTGLDSDCLRVVQIFHQGDCIVRNASGEVALDKSILLDVARFLCDYVFHIQSIRENIKTIAQKHAMRGTGALLAHIVNDYLIKELPDVRDRVFRNSKIDSVKFGWEINPDSFKNYGNVRILEFEDDNEYFNIDPTGDVRMTQTTNERYWEKIDTLEQDDSIGVFTKGEIQNFYRNTLGMGRLDKSKPHNHDSIADFLVSLFQIGANPIKYDLDEGEISNPIDDTINKSEEDYGYTKEERVEVQNNTELRKNQEDQFREYGGQDEFVTQGIYNFVNNRIFYFKNRVYSSHLLHPFMYNLKLWNKLNNIIINGYKDYVNNDFIDLLSSKVKFDELVGKFGESRNFWKYNIMDLTGYTTRYEAAIKDEHLDYQSNPTSELTGYDGLFYPGAALQFVQMYDNGNSDCRLSNNFFKQTQDSFNTNQKFVAAIYSIYWQEEKVVFRDSDSKSSEEYSFYTRWYSHLNYTRSEYQKIAMQLWYWRDRINDAILTEYDITKYCLDIQGNSLILLRTFKKDESESNSFLIDLLTAQQDVQNHIDGNANRNSQSCSNDFVVPSELWIRWKSNPIAVPALDIWSDRQTGDEQFDIRYRGSEQNSEFGQLTYLNNDCNQNFRVVVQDWKNRYGVILDYNWLPVFFDMEQSANVLALASWRLTPDGTNEFGDVKYTTNCAMNPFHIVSKEVIENNLSEYGLVEYCSNDTINSNGTTTRWMFDRYHYCNATGFILIPLYNFQCSDSQNSDNGFQSYSTADNLFSQILKIRLFVIPAQMIKNEYHSVNDGIQQLNDIEIDLNSIVDIYDNYKKYRFDYPIRVCRGTKVVFTAYENNGMNKIKCAFLGTFAGDTKGENRNSDTQFKTSSCYAKTRYEFDSQNTEQLSLSKGRYYDKNPEGLTQEVILSEDPTDDKFLYIDTKVYDGYNSYDALDKYVFVVDFKPSIDSKTMFDMNVMNDMSTYTYNILGDAGYIPHFAYQSLVKYNDKDGGTAYTWKNEYLKDKTHLTFELLGLDDKDIADTYDAMQSMIVKDTTDNCDTLINPAKLMDDIYRIWCETSVGKVMINGELRNMFFTNEYIEYTNPELTFTNGVAQWNVVTEDDQQTKFKVELPKKLDGQTLTEQESVNALSEVLNEYYLSILRTEDGDILNEKRYILPPTQLSQFIVGLGTEIDNATKQILSGNNNDANSYQKCDISRYQSSSIQDDHFSQVTVVFAGTPNPFNFDQSGERIFSRPEELQYGNSIRGVKSLYVKVDIGTLTEKIYETNIETGEQVEVEKDFKYIIPVIKMLKDDSQKDLTNIYSSSASSIDGGQITVIISHKNLDNIAKYHILNRSSNLYFNGSLPKNGLNQYKYSDFKYEKTVEVIETENGWRIKDGDELIDFTDADIHGTEVGSVTPQWDDTWWATPNQETSRDVSIDGGNVKLPPYFLVDDNGKPTWYLEQDKLVHDPENQRTIEIENPSPNISIKYIPQIGSFKFAHKVRSTPTKYLDYLYVKNGGLAFKVNEESYSMSDTMSLIPPFYVDTKLRNKLIDLNNVQVSREFSTFIHQSEKPQRVKDCNNFNPYIVNTIMNYGVLEKNDKDIVDFKTHVTGQMICTDCNDSADRQIIQLDNIDQKINMKLQFEDGEIDEYLKIYTNYVKVDDGNGDFHFDLYFNMQNLFNSPFEYISTVTKQPNVLIIPDSYLYLSGDKFKKDQDGNTIIDDKKIETIKNGGILTIYGQIKTYSNGKLSDVDTVKLFQYRVYNISDDKPKFLIDKIFDITKSQLENVVNNQVDISFQDVLWSVDASEFDDQQFKTLKDDIIVVQPLKIGYNWSKSDDSRLNSISFDIINDEIEFNCTPELLGYTVQRQHLENLGTGTMDSGFLYQNGSWCSRVEQDIVTEGIQYYDHWSDKYMKIERNPDNGCYRLTLMYDEDCGFNFETIYLRWKLPEGFRVMDTTDKLLGYVFSSTAYNIQCDCNNQRANIGFNVTKGHVVIRAKERNTMHLGMEHSTKKRLNGYILSSLTNAIATALGKTNPNAIPEGYILGQDNRTI